MHPELSSDTSAWKGSSGGEARREVAQGCKPCPCKNPAQPSWLPGCPWGHSWGTRATTASPGTGDRPAMVTAQEHLQDGRLLSHMLQDGSQSSLHSQETPGKKPPKHLPPRRNDNLPTQEGNRAGPPALGQVLKAQHGPKPMLGVGLGRGDCCGGGRDAGNWKLGWGDLRQRTLAPVFKK